jgi:hypothetical protein
MFPSDTSSWTRRRGRSSTLMGMEPDGSGRGWSYNHSTLTSFTVLVLNASLRSFLVPIVQLTPTSSTNLALQCYDTFFSGPNQSVSSHGIFYFEIECYFLSCPNQ